MALNIEARQLLSHPLSRWKGLRKLNGEQHGYDRYSHYVEGIGP